MIAAPVGEERLRGTFWFRSAVLIGGGALGGTALACGVLILRDVTFRVPELHSALLATLFLMAIVGLVAPRVRPWLPERSCQVASTTARHHGQHVTALMWGFQLGVGVLTFVVTPALYALVAILLAIEVVGWTLVIGATYGGTRLAVIAGVSSLRRRGTRDHDMDLLGLNDAMRSPMLILSILSVLLAFSW